MGKFQLRTGILGCGRVSEHYRYMLLERDPVPELKVVACCDLRSERSDRMGGAFGCATYTDMTRMLDEREMDLLVVLTPSGDHFEHARTALDYGVNVLVEKPITLNPEHAEELSRIAQRRGLFCASIFQNRYNPAVEATKRAMVAGRFKNIVTAGIRLRWCRYQEYYMDGWHGTWRSDGGVINQQAIHHVDALNWICGPVESVVAKMENRLNALEAEDTMVGLIRFANGALGTIEATTAARPRDFEASLAIVGEGGTVQIGGVALNRIEEWEFVEGAEEDRYALERFSEEVPSGYGLSHSRQLRDLIQSIKEGTDPKPVAIGDAVKTVELVHALYASIEKGGWVNMVDKPRSMKLGSG